MMAARPVLAMVALDLVVGVRYPGEDGNGDGVRREKKVFFPAVDISRGEIAGPRACSSYAVPHQLLAVFRKKEAILREYSFPATKDTSLWPAPFTR